MARRIRLSGAEARRVALAAQGFDRMRPANPSDARHFRRALRAITVLQLDFVNVLLPAHFLMIWSRIGGYDRSRFERWLYSDSGHTEQWAHEASVVAQDDWPALAYRRAAFQPHKRNPLHSLPDASAYLTEVLDQVRTQGALTAHDLPQIEGPRRKPGEWHRSVARCALEWHFGAGRLAVANRLPNFQRVYDLPERLIAESHRELELPDSEAKLRLARKSLRALGIGTLKDIADYYRMTATEIAPYLQRLIDAGDAREVAVTGWDEPAFLAANARLPRHIDASSVLSPFDPIVWFRPRALRLYGLEYRIEIYVPAAKRRWGYYVLPFLQGEQITARVDLKADRQQSALLVQSAYRESSADENTAARLAAELRELAQWLGLNRVVVKRSRSFERELKRYCA